MNPIVCALADLSANVVEISRIAPAHHFILSSKDSSPQYLTHLLNTTMIPEFLCTYSMLFSRKNSSVSFLYIQILLDNN